MAAHLTFKLGSLNVDTEDWAQGDELLTEAKQRLGRDGAGPACLYDLLDVNNMLGILWVNRAEPEKAVGFLDGAKEVYERMKARDDGEELSLRREASHTQTIFYLAQVVGSVGREDEAAALCGQCLTRQVANPGAGGSCFAVDDWCQNASQLGGYYLTKGMWATARALVAGAEHVFSKDFPVWAEAVERDTPELHARCKEAIPESYREVGANIQLAWGKLHLHRLQRGRDRLDGRYPLDAAAQAEESAGAEVVVSFPSLGLDAARPGQPPPDCGWVPADTAGARAVFNAAVPRYRAALRHYLLNGFVTEHCTALMDLSELHKALAAFEGDDIRRHCALHKRRAAPLEPIVTKLNHNTFQGLSKTMMYEVGEAHRACFEAKLSAGRPRARLLASGRRAVKGYTDFVAAYHEEGKPPQRVVEDEEHGYLTARFHLARLHSKCFSSGGARDDNKAAGEAEALARALREYEFLVDYCRRNEPPGFERELDICREMAQLLPQKIDALKKSSSS